MSNQTRILIVDDDVEICDLLGNYLSDFGFIVKRVHDGKSMREMLAQDRFDLLILDLMLPDEDGLSLCRQLRASSRIPIIMLTARNETADRVVGLELGADDYIVKPFDPRELVARMHSLLRRARHLNDISAHDKLPGDQIQFDGWGLDRTTRQLTSPDRMLIPLSNAEFRLLWAFVERPQRILSRDQLMDAARGQLCNAYDRSIDLLISRLRQKMREDPKNPQLLKTVRGAGYLFDARVVR